MERMNYTRYEAIDGLVERCCNKSEWISISDILSNSSIVILSSIILWIFLSFDGV